MDNPIIIIILALVAAALFFKFRKRSKPVEVIDDQEQEEELGSDEALANLKVFYCDESGCGVEIKSGQVITTKEKETCFEVKGYDIKNKEVELKPESLTWGKSCPCVKFAGETGEANCATCSIRGISKRNVWVKYKNGVAFGWKIQFL